MARQKQRRGGNKGHGTDFDGGGGSIRAIRTMSDVELDSEDECKQVKSSYYRANGNNSSCDQGQINVRWTRK
jgi:hypothetical protein